MRLAACVSVTPGLIPPFRLTFLDMMDNDDEVEDEANEEVDKVMDELALDVLDKTPNAPANARVAQAEEPEPEEAEDEEMRKMRERYDSLKGGV